VPELEVKATTPGSSIDTDLPVNGNSRVVGATMLAEDMVAGSVAAPRDPWRDPPATSSKSQRIMLRVRTLNVAERMPSNGKSSNPVITYLAPCSSPAQAMAPRGENKIGVAESGHSSSEYSGITRRAGCT
jgi:hypothetical protein